MTVFFTQRRNRVAVKQMRRARQRDGGRNLHVHHAARARCRRRRIRTAEQRAPPPTAGVRGAPKIIPQKIGENCITLPPAERRRARVGARERSRFYQQRVEPLRRKWTVEPRRRARAPRARFQARLRHRRRRPPCGVCVGHRQRTRREVDDGPRGAVETRVAARPAASTAARRDRDARRPHVRREQRDATAAAAAAVRFTRGGAVAARRENPAGAASCVAAAAPAVAAPDRLWRRILDDDLRVDDDASARTPAQARVVTGFVRRWRRHSWRV